MYIYTCSLMPIRHNQIYEEKEEWNKRNILQRVKKENHTKKT